MNIKKYITFINAAVISAVTLFLSAVLFYTGEGPSFSIALFIITLLTTPIFWLVGWHQKKTNKEKWALKAVILSWFIMFGIIIFILIQLVLFLDLY